MKKQPKKLTLNKETLRDLTAHNAGAVKGGGNKTYNKRCLRSQVTCGCNQTRFQTYCAC